MAENQPRGPQTRGNQFLQPQRGRRLPPGKLGHESHARILDAATDPPRLLRIQGEAAAKVDRLTAGTGGQNGQRAVPLRSKHEDGVDILAHRYGAEAVDRRNAKLGRGEPRAPAHLLADDAHLVAIGKASQRGPMPMIPSIAQAHQPYA